MRSSRNNRSRLRLSLQTLESRVAPATDTFTNLAGGTWATGSNWSLNNPPQTGDDAVITGLNAGAVVTLLSGGTTIIHGLELDAGNWLTLQTGNLTITNSGAIAGNLKVQSTNNLTVAAGATVNVTSGASFVGAASYPYTTGMVVNGSLNVAGATFTTAQASIQVNSGGHFTAANSTFGWAGLALANGSLLNPGDVVGNTFNQTITIPAADAALLADNLSFQDVDLQPGTLTSGQTVTMSPLGTVTTVNQRYVFTSTTGNLTVPAGATLNFTAGAVVVGAESYPYSSGIVVNGNMNVAGATFKQAQASIQVNSGGHFTAANSTFGWAGLALANGSLLNPGDVVGNTFNQTITIPAADAVLLANNASFQDIDIQPGSVTSGQHVTLALLGTANTANQRYVFTSNTGNFTVAAGATLDITNFVVVVGAESYPYTSGIVVNGTLNVTGATFTTAQASIQVNSGGHLTTANSTFGWAGLALANGSLLNPGDITGNTFNQTITVPATDVPLLADNASFQDIDIQPGSLTAGQTVTLPLLGTVTTGSQRYVFISGTGNFTVQAGATLNFANAVVVGAESYPYTSGIVVNGTLNVTGASFVTAQASIQVNSGGHFTAANSTFGWAGLALANGSLLNPGDIVGNAFNETITVPATDVALLADNASFQDIDFQPGALTSGQSVTLRRSALSQPAVSVMCSPRAPAISPCKRARR